MTPANFKLLPPALFALFLMATGCASPKDEQPQNAPQVKHVVVIGIDGMSVTGADQAHTPTFDHIKANGLYSYQGRNVLPTSSSPNWGTMLTSAATSMSGITSNDWRINDHKLPPMRTTENGWFPDVFYVLKKGNPALTTASVYHWSGFGNLYDHTFVDTDIDSKDEDETTQDAIRVIREQQPNFLFIHLDHVDHWGHAAGHMSPRYLQSVEKADSLAGKIIAAVKESGMLEQTLIIITSDHGGIGFGHGGESVEEATVPYYFYGGPVKTSGKLQATVTHFNLAPLSAYALGVPAPDIWLGSNLKCIFKGEADPCRLGKFIAPITSKPQILPQAANGNAGGLFINKIPRVTMQSNGSSGAIYYTLDGSAPTENAKKYTTPFEVDRSCQVKAAFWDAEGNQSPTATAYFRVVEGKNAGTRVRYRAYQGKDWHRLPDFSKEKAMGTGSIAEFSTDGLSHIMEDNTGMVFTSKFVAPRAGDYTFYTRSDDGSKLFVDGREVVNNDGDHGAIEKSGDIELSKGRHKIEVHYFNGGGGYLLTTLVKGPGMPRQILSPEFLEE